MTEHYDEFDTKEIILPKNLSPAEHRSTFQPLPPEPPAPSPFSREVAEAKLKKRVSVFDTIDPLDNRSPHVYESLLIGDTVHVPIPVRSADGSGARIPNAFRHEERKVTDIRRTERGYDAIVRNDAGLKSTLPVDVIGEEYNLEASIAKRLVIEDGVDIHSPDAVLIEDERQK